MSTKADAQQTERLCQLTRVGVTIGLVSFISIISIEVLRRVNFLNSSSRIGVLALTGAGLALVLSDFTELAHVEHEQEILLFYRKRYYWGVLLILSAVVAFLFCPMHRPPPPAPAAIVPAPEPPPDFPHLTISAVILNASHSAAVVNGKQLFLGECLMGVKIVGITESNITVELRGVRKCVAAFDEPLPGGGLRSSRKDIGGSAPDPP